MKKHSQTDLISRLKSRKILGVGGEDDDGEVHRSKVRLRHAMFYSSPLFFVFFPFRVHLHTKQFSCPCKHLLNSRGN